MTNVLPVSNLHSQVALPEQRQRLHDLRVGDVAHDVYVDDDHVSGFRSLVPAATDGFADVHWIQRPPLQSSSSSSQTFVDRRIPPSLA